MRVVKIISLTIVFTISMLIGLFIHSMQRGGGWIGGGQVYYVLNYGDVYNWEPGYDSLHGVFKGVFSEKKCSNAQLDTGKDGNLYVSSEACGTIMQLNTFIDRYFNENKIGELRFKTELPTELEQIAMFTDLKNKGLLDDIRYKQAKFYNWSDIGHLFLWSFIIPLAVTFSLWIVFKFFGWFFHILIKRSR